MDYKIPSQTTIGHVHLKVSNLDRALDFYCNLLGFEIITTYGDSAAFISAGGYHHHIGLNTWQSKMHRRLQKEVWDYFIPQFFIQAEKIWRRFSND